MYNQVQLLVVIEKMLQEAGFSTRRDPKSENRNIEICIHSDRLVIASVQCHFDAGKIVVCGGNINKGVAYELCDPECFANVLKRVRFWFSGCRI